MVQFVPSAGKGKEAREGGKGKEAREGGKRDEGRGKREDGRGKREDGRGKREEGREKGILKGGGGTKFGFGDGACKLTFL